MQDAEPSWICCGRCQWPLCRLYFQWKPTGEFYFTMSFFAFLPYWFVITGPGSLRLTQSQEIFWSLKQIFNFAARSCLENLKPVCRYVSSRDLFSESLGYVRGTSLFLYWDLSLQIPIWRQKNSKDATGLCIWDYHVICIQVIIHGTVLVINCKANCTLFPVLVKFSAYSIYHIFFVFVYILFISTLCMLNRETWKGKRLPGFGI